MSTKESLLSTKQVCAGFGVSSMCLSHWRAGSAKRAALPVKIDKRGTAAHSVGFVLSKVQAWAKKHDVAFDEKAALKEPGTQPATKKAAPVKRSATAPVKRPALKSTPVARKTAVAKKPTPVEVDKKKSAPRKRPIVVKATKPAAGLEQAALSLA